MRFLRKYHKMSTAYLDVPIGVRVIQKIGNLFRSHVRVNRPFAYKSSVLILTYVAYMCYHLTRKPISVVKAVLHRNCTNVEIPKDLIRSTINESTWCDYPPFDGSDSAALLGYLDSAFLFSYGFAMFASGFIAERVSLRYFLAFGMLSTGIFTYMFGIAKPYDIHSIWYFVFVQAAAGIAQTTGWPSVVTILGRWFGKSKRGLIFGIWNSHTSIGNILGTLVASHYVETDWSMSFIMPGLIMGIAGFLIFLFLVDAPELVGCQEREPTGSAADKRAGAYSRIEAGDGGDSADTSDVDDTDILIGEQENPSIRSMRGSVNSEVNYRPTERTPILDTRGGGGGSLASSAAQRQNHQAIGFMGALRIPGVIEFSLCLFFSKLVSYTFLFWLPMYIQSTTTLGPSESADLSTLFDVGGIVGAIAAGVISDYSGMSACTCAGMLIFAAPMLLVYQWYGTLSYPINIFLLFVVGIVVNGPYALITTSVSAELGQHSSLEGNSKALATVTAIIDGTGSFGAAVGPLIAGLISNTGWQNVFYMLMTSDVLALLLLIRLVCKEIERRRRNPRID